MNKLNKGKLVGVVAASLSAVSLMGVGFAAWVINGTTPDTTGDISVTVAAIEDNRIIVESATPKGNLVFEAASEDTSGTIHTKPNSPTPVLNFKVAYTVKLGKGLSDFNINAKWTLGTDSASIALGQAIANRYLASPLSTSDVLVSTKAGHGTAYGADTDNKTHTNIFSTATAASGVDGFSVYNVETVFHFAWGSKTESRNPSYYDDTPEHTTAALEALNGLEAANNAKFTITLTPSVVTTRGN